MPNRGDRGGSRTRARISDVASELFLERGFDDVTIAEVAAAAGVSKVTVFAHFERKEDLLLDRLPDAIELARATIAERPEGVSAPAAVHAALAELSERRHVLSGLSDGVEPFARVVLASPSLIGRIRVFASEIESTIADALRADPRDTDDPALTAALIVAAGRVVGVETIRQRVAGIDADDVARDHRRRLDQAFAAVERAVAR